MPTRERYPCATVVPVSSSLRDVVGAPPAGQTARVGELNMVRVKRWFVGIVVGGMLLVGLTSCVVVPVEVAPRAMWSRHRSWSSLRIVPLVIMNPIATTARIVPIMAGIPTAIGGERACEDAEACTGAQDMTGLPFCFPPRSGLHKNPDSIGFRGRAPCVRCILCEGKTIGRWR